MTHISIPTEALPAFLYYGNSRLSWYSISVPRTTLKPDLKRTDESVRFTRNNTMIRSWILWIVAIAALVTPGQAQVVVLEGGTLIDGTGKAPVANAVVVIEGTRIKAAGAKGQVAYPQNARVLKTDGKFILPGLIDSHIHLKDHMPPMFLRYGVTTVGDTNNHTEWSIAQRDALKTGRDREKRRVVLTPSLDRSRFFR